MTCDIVRRIGVIIVLVLLQAGVAIAQTNNYPNEVLKFTELPQLPAPAFGQFAGESNGAIIVAGGQLIDGAFLDSVYVLEGSTWRSYPMRNPAAFGSSASAKGSLMCVGGTTAQGYSSQVLRLTWKEGQLTQTRLADLPAPRAGAGVAVIDNMLYTACGIGSEDIIKTENSLFVLDLDDETAQWEELPSCPGPGRIDPVMEAQFGAFYLIGGQEIRSGTQAGGEYLTLNDCWSYRPEALDGTSQKGWIRIADIPEAVCASAVVPTGQAHVMVVGGISKTLNARLNEYIPSKTIWSYHSITDTWVKLGAVDEFLPYTRWVAGADGLILIGGIALNGRPSPVIHEATLRSTSGVLQNLDYVSITIYLIVLVGIGTYFARRTKTSKEYFLGGRRIPWWAVGISLYATATSAISFLAIPTKTFVTNQVYGLGTLWGPIFIIIAAYLIIPILRGIDITSTFEYLERRFNKAVRLFGAGIAVAFQLGGRMSVVMLLPSFALSAVTGINVFYAIAIMGVLATIYTVMGGISAVIWTDLLQVAILLGGTAIAFGMMIAGTDGGFKGFIDINLEYSKFDAFQFGWDLTLPLIWVFMLNQMMTQANFPSDQVMVQRVLTTPSVKAARKSYILLGLIVVPSTLLFHFLGSSLFSFFHTNPDLLSPTMDNIHVFPLYIVEVLPVGMTGLLIAALFAASMSTLDSGMNSVATVLLTDFYPRLKEVSDATILTIAKYLTALIGIIGTGIALLMATYDIKSMFDMWMEIIALIGGGFGGVFLLGIFTKRANGPGVLVGAAVSIILTWAVKYYTDIHFMLYSTVAVVSCVFIGYVASLFFQPPKNEMEGLTIYTNKSK